MNTLYASLYPSLYRQYNIAPNTQIGKVIIPDKVHEMENRRHSEHWDRAGAFFEDFHTHYWIIVGQKWFNLPGIVEMYEYLKDYFNHYMQPSNMFGFEEGPRELIQPIVFLDKEDEEGWSPIVFKPDMPEDKIKEWKEYVENNPNQSY